jgi:hypothetical protein
VMCFYDVKDFCSFGYFSCWSAPRRVFISHGDDPHLTVPCYRPGRIGGWRRRWRRQPSGPGQCTLDGIKVYGGSLAGPVPCDIRDRSLPPKHTAGGGDMTVVLERRQRRLGASCSRVIPVGHSCFSAMSLISRVRVQLVSSRQTTGSVSLVDQCNRRDTAVPGRPLIAISLYFLGQNGCVSSFAFSDEQTIARIAHSDDRPPCRI